MSKSSARKARNAALTVPLIETPSPERLRQPDAPVAVTELDPGGWQTVHYRAPDTLSRLLKAGLIDPNWAAAGERFRRDYRSSAFDPLSASDLRRPRGAGGRSPIIDRVEDARERLWSALCRLGGLASPSGSIVWHVLGRDQSLQQWTLRQDWAAGRSIRHEVATGILIAALATLDRHYTEPRRSRGRPETTAISGSAPPTSAARRS